MKAKFSIPFNGDLVLAQEALSSGQVSEVYFALPGIGSGASKHLGTRDTAGGSGSVVELVRRCRRFGVKTNMLCNSPSLERIPLAPIFAAARLLKVSSITLADPLVIGHAKRALPGVRIQSSVIMDLNSEERIRQVLAAGVRTVTLAAETNRNLSLLGRIKLIKSGFPDLKVKLIANYNCGYDCVFRNAHCISSMLGGAARTVSGADCWFQRAEDFQWLKRPFIRPEDLALYEKKGLVDEFKLIDRSQASPVLENVYKAYFRRKFNGNLQELLGGKDFIYIDNSRFPKGFAGKVAVCNKDCAACGYCRGVYKRVMVARAVKKNCLMNRGVK